MSPIGEGRVIGVQFGVVINAESCMGWKPHKLEGCRGLNNFSTRLGVTTEFCRGDTNVTNVSRVHLNASDKVGVHPGHPGWAAMKGIIFKEL